MVLMSEYFPLLFPFMVGRRRRDADSPYQKDMESKEGHEERRQKRDMQGKEPVKSIS